MATSTSPTAEEVVDLTESDYVVPEDVVRDNARKNRAAYQRLTMVKGRELVLRILASNLMLHRKFDFTFTSYHLDAMVQRSGSTAPSCYRAVWLADAISWMIANKFIRRQYDITGTVTLAMSPQQIGEFAMAIAHWTPANPLESKPSLTRSQLAVAIMHVRDCHEFKDGMYARGCMDPDFAQPAAATTTTVQMGPPKRPPPSSPTPLPKKRAVPEPAVVARRTRNHATVPPKTPYAALRWMAGYVLGPLLRANQDVVKALPVRIANETELHNSAMPMIVLTTIVNMLRARYPSKPTADILKSVPDAYEMVARTFQAVSAGRSIAGPMLPIPMQVALFGKYTVVSTGSKESTHVRICTQKIPTGERTRRVSFKAGFDVWAKYMNQYSTVHQAIQDLFDTLQAHKDLEPTVQNYVMVLSREAMCWFYGTVQDLDQATNCVTIQYTNGKSQSIHLLNDDGILHTLCAIAS